MIYHSVNLDLTEKINPLDFSKYLKDTGWNLFQTKRKDVEVYQYEKGDEFHQVIVPLEKKLADYKEAIYKAIKTVAEVEKKSVEQVMLYLLNPNTDILKIRLENRFFKADKINTYTTRITGAGGENCYLLEGGERALLIDGLTGVGSLKAFVRELTDLPVTLALTHGHLDHSGAAWEYRMCYMHPADIPLMYSSVHSSERRRLEYVLSSELGTAEKKNGITLKDVVPACAVKTLPLYEGNILDLGGLSIEVLGIPGHTCGSLVYLDRASGLLFSGDACNANTLLGLEGSTSVEEYLESLQHFKKYQDAFSCMFGGHGKQAVPATIVDDAITLCRKIMDGKDDAVRTKLMGDTDAFLAAERGEDYLPKSGGYANIVYRKEQIRRAADQEWVITIQDDES